MQHPIFEVPPSLFVANSNCMSSEHEDDFTTKQMTKGRPRNQPQDAFWFLRSPLEIARGTYKGREIKKRTPFFENDCAVKKKTSKKGVI